MMNRGCSVGCSGVFGTFVTLLVLGTPAIKLTWGWIVPEVLPGAVSQGLVAGIDHLADGPEAGARGCRAVRGRGGLRRRRVERARAIERRICDIQSPNGGFR